MDTISRKEAKAAGLKRYFTGKECLRGHVDERIVGNGKCMACARESEKLARESNPEKYRKRDLACREKNLEKRRQYSRDYNARNKDKFRAYANARYRHPIHGIACVARNVTYRSITRAGYKKSSKAERILGCSFDEFRKQIERQFEPWMSWGNYGEWHIDHIIPLSSAKSEDEVLSLCRVSNLRPIRAEENQAKYASVTHLL